MMVKLDGKYIGNNSAQSGVTGEASRRKTMANELR